MNSKIKIKKGQSLYVDFISVLFIILFIFNLSWLKKEYYFDTTTIWHKVHSYSSILLIFYLFTLLFIFILSSKRIKLCFTIFLVFVFMMYEIIVTYYNGMLTVSSFQQIVIWPMCIIIGYLYFDKTILEKHNIFIIRSSIIIYGLLSISSIISHLSGRGNIGGVIFPVYVLITMMSFLLIQKESVIKKILILFVIMMILLTTKRTGLLCVTFGVIIYSFISIIRSKRKLKKLLKGLMAFSVVCIACLWAVDYYKLDVFQRFNKLSEDGGSGRDVIWSQVYTEFSNSKVTNKIFGHGFHAVPLRVRPTGREILAHNDYLELLYDFGLLGLILIVIIVFIILYKLFYYIKNNDKLAPSYGYVCSCFILLSLFSYLMDQSLLINYFALFIGMTFNGDWKQKMSC